MLVGTHLGQQEDVVDLTNGFKQTSSVNDDLVVEDGGKQGLDDLHLYLGRRCFALEAVAYRVNGSFDERWSLLGLVGIRGYGEIGVTDEFANAVKRGSDDGYGVGFRGQLQRSE